MKNYFLILIYSILGMANICSQKGEVVWRDDFNCNNYDDEIKKQKWTVFTANNFLANIKNGQDLTGMKYRINIIDEKREVTSLATRKITDFTIETAIESRLIAEKDKFGIFWTDIPVNPLLNEKLTKEELETGFAVHDFINGTDLSIEDEIIKKKYNRDDYFTTYFIGNRWIANASGEYTISINGQSQNGIFPSKFWQDKNTFKVQNKENKVLFFINNHLIYSAICLDQVMVKRALDCIGVYRNKSNGTEVENIAADYLEVRTNEVLPDLKINLDTLYKGVPVSKIHKEAYRDSIFYIKEGRVKIRKTNFKYLGLVGNNKIGFLNKKRITYDTLRIDFVENLGLSKVSKLNLAIKDDWDMNNLYLNEEGLYDWVVSDKKIRLVSISKDRDTMYYVYAGLSSDVLEHKHEIMYLNIKGKLVDSFKIKHDFNLKKNILNLEYFSFLGLSPDKKVLIGACMSYCGTNLYVSIKEKRSNIYSQPIKTNIKGSSPQLSADGKTLYFLSSAYEGKERGDDIFVSQRLDDSWLLWSEPVNLGLGDNKYEGIYNLRLLGKTLIWNRGANTPLFKVELKN